MGEEHDEWRRMIRKFDTYTELWARKLYEIMYTYIPYSTENPTFDEFLQRKFQTRDIWEAELQAYNNIRLRTVIPTVTQDGIKMLIHFAKKIMFASTRMHQLQDQFRVQPFHVSETFDNFKQLVGSITFDMVLSEAGTIPLYFVHTTESSYEGFTAIAAYYYETTKFIKAVNKNANITHGYRTPDNTSSLLMDVTLTLRSNELTLSASECWKILHDCLKQRRDVMEIRQVCRGLHTAYSNVTEPRALVTIAIGILWRIDNATRTNPL